MGDLVQNVVSSKGGVVGDEVKSRLNMELAILQPEAFARSLADLKVPRRDAAFVSGQAELLEALRTALAGLDTLADERIRPKEVLAKEVLETQKAIGQVDLKKSPTEIARDIESARAKALHDFQFDVLAEKIKKAPLSPAVRDHLLQTLSSNPDPRYRTMISAYINPLLPAPAKEKQP